MNDSTAGFFVEDLEEIVEASLKSWFIEERSKSPKTHTDLPLPSSVHELINDSLVRN